MERRIRAGGGRPPGSSRQATSIFPESARRRETYARRQARLLSASRIDSPFYIYCQQSLPLLILVSLLLLSPFPQLHPTHPPSFPALPPPFSNSTPYQTQRVIENESGKVHKFVARHYFSHILSFPFHRSSYSYCRFSLTRCGQEIGVFVSEARWRG